EGAARDVSVDEDDGHAARLRRHRVVLVHGCEDETVHAVCEGLYELALALEALVRVEERGRVAGVARDALDTLDDRRKERVRDVRDDEADRHRRPRLEAPG